MLAHYLFWGWCTKIRQPAAPDEDRTVLNFVRLLESYDKRDKGEVRLHFFRKHR